MSILLYQSNSYLNNFSARVTGLNQENHAIILDQTGFYPGGGGQPYDIGSINTDETSMAILRVRKSGEEILHFIDTQIQLPSLDTEIVGVLDWDRRYKLMRTHTALHILCGVVFRDYGALVTGGDMDLNQGRMDFEFETMHKELVQEIEMAVNNEVAKELPIRISILPRNEAFKIPDLIRTKINLLPEGIEKIRTVEIVGLDLQADGGTHVQNTKEVGKIRITDYKSKGKINKRIYLRLDD